MNINVMNRRMSLSVFYFIDVISIRSKELGWGLDVQLRMLKNVLMYKSDYKKQNNKKIE